MVNDFYLQPCRAKGLMPSPFYTASFHVKLRQWLQMAARQGCEDAATLLLRHFR